MDFSISKMEVEARHRGPRPSAHMLVEMFRQSTLALGLSQALCDERAARLASADADLGALAEHEARAAAEELRLHEAAQRQLEAQNEQFEAEREAMLELHAATVAQLEEESLALLRLLVAEGRLGRERAEEAQRAICAPLQQLLDSAAPASCGRAPADVSVASAPDDASVGGGAPAADAASDVGRAPSERAPASASASFLDAPSHAPAAEPSSFLDERPPTVSELFASIRAGGAAPSVGPSPRAASPAGEDAAARGVEAGPAALAAASPDVPPSARGARESAAQPWSMPPAGGAAGRGCALASPGQPPSDCEAGEAGEAVEVGANLASESELPHGGAGWRAGGAESVAEDSMAESASRRAAPVSEPVGASLSAFERSRLRANLEALRHLEAERADVQARVRRLLLRAVAADAPGAEGARSGAADGSAELAELRRVAQALAARQAAAVRQLAARAELAQEPAALEAWLGLVSVDLDAVEALAQMGGASSGAGGADAPLPSAAAVSAREQLRAALAEDLGAGAARARPLLPGAAGAPDGRRDAEAASAEGEEDADGYSQSFCSEAGADDAWAAQGAAGACGGGPGSAASERVGVLQRKLEARRAEARALLRRLGV